MLSPSRNGQLPGPEGPTQELHASPAERSQCAHVVQRSTHDLQLEPETVRSPRYLERRQVVVSSQTVGPDDALQGRMAIVCGTDFSEAAMPGLWAAGAIASRTREAEFWLVHVLDGGSSKGLDPVEWDVLKGKTDARLRADAQQLRSRFSLPHVYTMTLVGSASGVLTEFARVKRASLLVVSARDPGASSHLRLGDTTERIAVRSDVPTLVVRDAAAFERWARGERPLRVLLGVDWTKSSESALRLVRVLRAAGRCDVIVAHVRDARQCAEHYGINASDASEERAVELLTRDLETYVGELGGEGSVVFQPLLGARRSADRLLETAQAQAVDLIVVGTHRRTGLRRLGSVSSVILHCAHASVACVPTVDALAPNEPRSMRTVLIATDLSAASHAAVSLGYRLLAEQGGSVHLLHVTPDRSPVSRSQLLEQLSALIPAWAASHGIVTQLEIVELPDVPRAIMEAAARNAADTVCVGTHGRSGVGRLVLGSVAEQVVRQSSHPVLVARPPPP